MVLEGDRRFDVVVRLADELRNDPAVNKVEESDLTMVAQNLVTLDDKGVAKKVLDLVDALDDLDDVQAVHGNFDITDDVLAELG